ncbi:MAG: nickel pincer cofactor biosynthesis protein LarC [Propionibacteriaceae bacterium]|nr:nickel pincer cofactor biosynthesis protein LarC [Propionibacteriaceae bacterium]
MHDITTGGHHHPGIATADGKRVPEGIRIEATAVLEHAPRPDRRIWIDASQGASGDMLLGALIDAGADAGSIAAVLDLVAPNKLHLQTRRVPRGPFSAMKVDVIADEPNPPARHLSDIVAMLSVPGIPQFTVELALAAFRPLAEAEAAVHGTTVEQVHFHEVGALDSIGDIVGVAEAIRTLGVEHGSSSVVAVGSGTIATQHGLLSVPPPAVIELSKGWQVEAGGPPEASELCTPTGMALIRALCDRVEGLPAMTVDSIGTGAGSRIRADRPGVLRVVVGSSVNDPRPTDDEHADVGTQMDTPREVSEVAANIDDLDPRLWPAVLDRLLEAGAVDAWLTPIIMKKGRPSHVVTALVHPSGTADVIDALITHTSTIGVRVSAPWRRRVLERAWVPVDVSGHPVRIKVAGDGPGTGIRQATAEFVDVEALATALGVPQRVALANAQAAAWAAGLHPGGSWPTEANDG